jgi:uncharacterized protein (DUF1684 family)
MIRYFLLFGLLLSGIFGCKNEAYHNEIIEHQFELNASFADPAHSPLLEEDLLNFKGLTFFPIDEDYRVVARLTKTPNASTFEMPTTTDRKPLYKKYGEAHFTLAHRRCSLLIFQNIELIKKPGFEQHLFLPFGDLSNADKSYGGGRFIDLMAVEGDEIVIDFNKAYNPYCAYNHEYSCPIPPKENRLEVEILAGVMAPENHH